MAEFVTLSCPNCGGKLEITSDIDRFACGHCGIEHLVRRQGGIVSLSPVVDQLEKIEAGTDRTANELTLVRLSKESYELSAAVDAKEQALESDYTFTFYLLSVGVVLLVMGCGALAVLASIQDWDSLYWGLILGIGGVGLIVVARKADNRGSKRKELENLKSLLNEKMNEIEYYRNLV